LCYISLLAILHKSHVNAVKYGADRLSVDYGLISLIISFHQYEENFEQCIVAIIANFLRGTKKNLRQ
jgi:hypothetical protein